MTFYILQCYFTPSDVFMQRNPVFSLQEGLVNAPLPPPTPPTLTTHQLHIQPAGGANWGTNNNSNHGKRKKRNHVLLR